MQNRLQSAFTSISFVAAGISVALLYLAPIAIDQYGDFEAHVEIARKIAATHGPVVPHFGFHVMILSIARVTGAELISVAHVSAAVAQGVTCLLLIWVVRDSARLLCLPRPIGRSTALIAGFALSFVGPLSLFTYPNLFLGYPAISCAHNPTVAFLRPWAILLFVAALRLLNTTDRNQWNRLAVVTIAAAAIGGLTKPSFNICFAPAMGILLLDRYGRDRRLPKRHLASFMVVAVPILAVSLWQFSFTYGLETQAGVIFAPLKVMSYWNGGSGTIAVAKVFLALAFPMFVIVAYRKAAGVVSQAYKLAWIAALVALGIAYGLAETGVRELHGNFIWGTQVCLLILIAVSLVVFLSEENCFEGPDPVSVTWKTLAGSVLFLLHFFSGFAFVLLAPRVS